MQLLRNDLVIIVINSFDVLSFGTMQMARYMLFA